MTRRRELKVSAKQITTTAVLLAICILSQFLKNLSVYITGPIINACLIIAVLSVGLTCAIILSVITPVTAFFITGSPIMAAVPLLIPAIMIGNIVLVVIVARLKGRGMSGNKIMLPASMIIGSILKAAVMGILIAVIILPNMLPEPMLPKLGALQMQFSLTQLITALIGSVYAYVIWIPLKKVWAK